MIRLEHIALFGAMVNPYRTSQQPLKRLNRSTDGPGTRQIFTPAARNAIEDNYRWTIDNFYPETNTAITGDHHDGKEEDREVQAKIIAKIKAKKDAKKETEDCHSRQSTVYHVTGTVCR